MAFANYIEQAKKLFVASEKAMNVSVHPYYPTDLQLPGYQPLVIPFEQILIAFFGTCALLLILMWSLSAKMKRLSGGERLGMAWLVLTGLIHIVVEGAVVLRSDFYKDSSGNILLEIWKEYAKADSRYATRDSFVISMEAVTAFVVGPLCLLTAYGMAQQKPWRYTLGVLVSICQLYGDVLYFGTTYHEGLKHSRPEFLYFWFYFVIVNSIWVVIPALVTLQAAKQISSAVSIADRSTLTMSSVKPHAQ